MLSSIKKLNLNPSDVSHIIITHAHFDHFEGAPLWQKEFGTKIVTNQISKDIIENPNDERTAAFIFGEKHNPFRVDETFEFEKELSIGGLVLKTIHLPGHTPDNTGFYGLIDKNKVCFVADVCGAFNPKWLSNSKDEQESVKKLMTMDIDILCHGHRYFTKDLIQPLLKNWLALSEDEQFAYFLARRHQI